MSIPERHRDEFPEKRRDATQGKRLGKFPERHRDEFPEERRGRSLLKLPGRFQQADVPHSPA